jgi:hypothetical protein
MTKQRYDLEESPEKMNIELAVGEQALVCLRELGKEVEGHPA